MEIFTHVFFSQLYSFGYMCFWHLLPSDSYLWHPLASSPAGPPDGREPTFLYMVNSRHLTHVCGICVVRGLCPLPRLALPPTPDAQDHTHLLLTTARPGGSALLQGACPQSQLLRNGGHKLPRTRQAQRCLWGSSRDPTGEVPARSHLQASP